MRIASARSASCSRPRGSSSFVSVHGGSFGWATRQEPKAIRSPGSAAAVGVALAGARADAARRPAVVARPHELAVEAHVVRARLRRLEAGDMDEREVMALDLEGAIAAAADLDLARHIGLDPDRRVLGSDVAQQGSEDEAGHGRAWRSRLERGQPCSSGAMVRPASLSCSQYSSAGSFCPLQTMAWPVLWMRS